MRLRCPSRRGGSWPRPSCCSSRILLTSQIVAFAGDDSGIFDLAATDITILNPESKEVLGHAHYKVTHQDGAILFEGENRFLDGEYDHEVERVEPRSDGAAPVLVSYEHSFFNADGSPESIDALDAKTGILACTHFPDGAPDVRHLESRRAARYLRRDRAN